MKEFLIRYWLEVGFGVIIAALGAGYKCLAARVQQQIKNQRSLCEGTKALLRNEIIRSYDKYVAKGWMPVYGRENVQAMYDSYHALAGNGSIDQLMKELRELPSKDVEGK